MSTVGVRREFFEGIAQVLAGLSKISKSYPVESVQLVSEVSAKLSSTVDEVLQEMVEEDAKDY